MRYLSGAVAPAIRRRHGFRAFPKTTDLPILNACTAGSSLQGKIWSRMSGSPQQKFASISHLLRILQNDMTAELVCSPPGSAGPFQPKVLSRAMQERCKTGKWSHVVVCERFFVGKEGTSLVSRLVSQGHWVGGLKVDRFVLVPLDQAPQN